MKRQENHHEQQNNFISEIKPPSMALVLTLWMHNIQDFSSGGHHLLQDNQPANSIKGYAK